jgi:hypothetical protein
VPQESIVSAGRSEYHFRCNGCGAEVVIVPSEDEATEDHRPGPYCEKCGAHESYALLRAAEPRFRLYWVETEDHDEDWFVVEEDEEAAAFFHEMAEGYDEDYAEASLVCELPVGVDAEAGWPSFEVLEACGANIVRRETPRVVEIGGRVYCEGALDDEINRVTDDLFEKRDGSRLNRTKRGRIH